jgi:hypothetical protein
MQNRATLWIAIISVTLFGRGTSAHASAQAPGFAEITSPRDGEALVGIITIEGSANHPSFSTYNLAFAYEPNPSDTWFPIVASVTTPVPKGKLGLWDTTRITDGTYQLRLQVHLRNGTTLEAVIHGVRIRNFTSIETETPGPVSVMVTETPLPPTITPTATPVPPVPVGSVRVLRALAWGAASGVLALLALGFYLAARRNLRLRWSAMQKRRDYKRTNQRRADRPGRGR